MIRITVRRERAFEGPEAVVADAMQAMAEGLSTVSAVQVFAVPGKDLRIEVILGGATEAEKFDVVPEAMGFFAVSSGERYDDYDPDLHDEPPGQAWFDVPEGFEAHVNVEAIAALLMRKWDGADATDRACDFVAAADTVPHEVLHALEWIRATGGMTPLEVFDSGKGELSLQAVMQDIDTRAAGAPTNEEETEDLARIWTDSLLPLYEAEAWVERLGEAMPSGPSPR